MSCISLCISVGMMLLTIASVFFAYREYKHQKERAKKEVACNLAKYYADSIIKAHAFISSVFTKCGILEYIKNCIDLDSINDFDLAELNNLLEIKKINTNEFKQRVLRIDPFVVLNCRLARKEFLCDRNKIYSEFVKKGEDEDTLILKNADFLLSDFMQDISNLLNDLEWFSMNCIYMVADEELLYQSLHQTFLSIVWMLYFFIAVNNTNNEDKTFTNTIALFHMWRCRLNGIVDCSKKKTEKFEKKEEKIRKEKENSKPKIYTGKKL